MSSLQDTVRLVVLSFVGYDALFTALDVSNKVKATNPNARHREVRDAVRDLFASEIEPCGYARTPITVSLDDGTTATALLYHPLSDSWDLDNKYSQQQRSQVSSRPVAVAQAAVQAAQNMPPTRSYGAFAPTATASTATPLPNVATITVSAPVPLPTARHLWDQMFQTQPSLFPKS
jgi:hypothetical protein